LPLVGAAGQYVGELPAPLTPLGEMRPFSAQRGVVAMTWVHHGVIVETAEDLAFQVIHQRISSPAPRTVADAATQSTARRSPRAARAHTANTSRNE